jgi:hypothetical protein
MTIHADGSNLREVLRPSTNFSDYGSPAWSPDGRRIAFNAYSGEPKYRNDVFVVNIDGTGLSRAFQPPPAGPDPETWSPAWSPTGDQLAADAFTWNGIYVGPVGGTPRRIEPTGLRPSWSPDGSRIVFARQPELSSRTEIYSMRTDGTDITRLTVTVEGASAPDWQRRPGSAPPPGLTRLSSGALSIPAASVAPAKLVLSSVHMTPWPRRPGSPLNVRLVLRDSRGYVVRGATVSVRSSPVRRLVRSLPARTRPDGSTAVWIDPRGKARSLVVFVTARVPGASVTGRYVVRPG